MKKTSVYLVVSMLLLSVLCSSCSTAKWLWCTSNGIMTYNPHTGQFEVVWEYAAQPSVIVHDTVYVTKSFSDRTDSDQ